MKKRLHRNDILLNVAIIALCVVSYVVLYFTGSQDAKLVAISFDGEEIYSLPLDKDESVSVNGVTVVIKDKKTYVSQSDCPDGLCMKMKKAEKISDSIICVPNKVSIRIVGKDREADVVAG